jgi:hypothetical protein
MSADESHVDAPGDHWLQGRIVGRLAKAVEPPVFQSGNAGRELKAQQGAQSKDMFGVTAAISVVTPGRDFALMVEGLCG